MKTKEKVLAIFLSIVPIILMIGIIPLFENDYFLVGVYVAIIATAFVIKYERKDYLFFVVGFFLMLFFEYFFVMTRVETFVRNGLFGLMPVWLPVLWAYSFVAMRRVVTILDK
jgi:hypothetical protein